MNATIVVRILFVGLLWLLATVLLYLGPNNQQVPLSLRWVSVVMAVQLIVVSALFTSGWVIESQVWKSFYAKRMEAAKRRYQAAKAIRKAAKRRKRR